jgi:pyoverdine/dityrosine biosynthesis protein Dit1
VAIPANGNGASLLEQNVLKDPIVPPDSDVLSEDHNMTMEVLKIIESYGVDFEQSGVSWKGFDSFVPIVLSQIERQEPIRMILPAFPFKSPNARDKVLGNMPDFGEELALSHLNGLCQNIADVYEPGANVYISSDGLVYNGELQQSYSSSFH